MNTKSHWLTGGAAAMLVAASVFLAGCATEPPLKPAGLEQRIENAKTRADHEQIASLYEQQAGAEKAAAGRHEGMARSYRNAGRNSDPAMAGHCENLARTYRQAAEENLALAKLHRKMAADAKQ